MAHVRRKFTDAQGSHPHLAAQAVECIELLYELEAGFKAGSATPDRIAAERQAKALPIMDAIEKWMEYVHTQCTPSAPMGKTLDYAYKLWPRLRRYADNGIYHIDNNPVERNQRPTGLGRKNYLFRDQQKRQWSHQQRHLLLLLESCDTVGINAIEWLTYVLENLHDDTPTHKIVEILPFYYKKSCE